MLELGKALSFFISLASLYAAAITAFFVPGARWEDRLLLALPKFALATIACLFAGMVFIWPSRTNPEAGHSLLSTLPVRFFLWGTIVILAAFCLSWYLVANVPCDPRLQHNCFLG